MDQDEQALRQRIETAVRHGPGPDPARLAAIRARLGTQRNARRRNLWLAAALAAALGSTAVAALWLQAERGAEQASEDQAGPDAGNPDGATPNEAPEPAIESAPVETHDHDEDASDPVIFRE